MGYNIQWVLDNWEAWSMLFPRLVICTLAAAVLVAGRYSPFGEPGGESVSARLAAVGIPLVAGVGAYLALSAALGLEEIWGLVRRRREGADSE